MSLKELTILKDMSLRYSHQQQTWAVKQTHPAGSWFNFIGIYLVLTPEYF